MAAHSQVDWEEAVQQGRWLTQARALGVSKETFQRFDSVKQQVVDGPESVLWARVESYFAEYQHCPTVAQLQQEVDRAAATNQLSQQSAQSLMSVLSQVVALEPRPQAFGWAMDLLSAEAKRQRISQKVFAAVSRLHDDPDQALEILRSVETPNLEQSIVALSQTGPALQQEYDRAKRGEAPLCRLGIRAFDDQEGGLRAGQFLIVGGREGSGKSWLATWVARNVGLHGGLVVMVSGEMTWVEYAARFVGLELGVDPQQILHGGLGALEQRFKDYCSALHQVDGDVVLLNRGRYSSTQIADTVKLTQDAKQRPVDLLVIDPVYKVIPTVRSGRREEDHAQIAVDVKAMSLDLKLPIFTTHQLNRDASEYPDAVGEVFKYSDAYSDEADWLWRIESRDKLLWEVLVGKGRAGHSHWRFKVYRDLDRGFIGEQAPGVAAQAAQGPAGAAWGVGQ